MEFFLIFVIGLALGGFGYHFYAQEFLFDLKIPLGRTEILGWFKSHKLSVPKSAKLRTFALLGMRYAQAKDVTAEDFYKKNK